MLTILKYLPSLFALKDVTDQFQIEQGKDKPILLAKRVVGSALTAGSVIIPAVFGYQIDQGLVDHLINSINTMFISVNEIYNLINVSVIPAIVGAYGAFMALKGQMDVSLRKQADKLSTQKTEVK
jgi:hypothetical protein